MQEQKVEARTPGPGGNAAPTAPRTMYVHLCSGAVREVPRVTRVQVTQSHLILERYDASPVLFPRRIVYFACSEAGEQPAAY
jgi:hypothetical protein